jgi:hypothetical protein
MTDEQAKTIIQELQIIRKLVYTYGLGEDIPSGPSPGILAGIKSEIQGIRELLEERSTTGGHMKPHAVEFLLKTLADMGNTISDTEIRIKALETALQKYEPNQYQCYLDAVRKTTQAIEKSERKPVSPAGIEALRKALLQD